jgi:hypothetical protein
MKIEKITTYPGIELVERYLWLIPHSSARVPVIRISEKSNTDSYKWLQQLFFSIEELKKEAYSYVIIFDVLLTDNIYNILHKINEEFSSKITQVIFVISEKNSFEFINSDLCIFHSLTLALNESNKLNTKLRQKGGSIPEYKEREINLNVFKNVKFDELINVYRYSEDTLSGLIIELLGELAPGSGDDEKIDYIMRVFKTHFIIENPQTLIVDATCLGYTWGDKLSLFPNIVRRDTEYAARIILKPEQLEPFAYVLGSEKRICSTVEQAIEELKTQIGYQK